MSYTTEGFPRFIWGEGVVRIPVKLISDSGFS